MSNFTKNLFINLKIVFKENGIKNNKYKFMKIS